jgi:hypothetical protein
MDAYQTDFQKHLNNCARCRHNPNNMCPTGERLFLHEIVKDLNKDNLSDEQSLCQDCNPFTNPKCKLCLGC